MAHIGPSGIIANKSCWCFALHHASLFIYFEDSLKIMKWSRELTPSCGSLSQPLLHLPLYLQISPIEHLLPTQSIQDGYLCSLLYRYYTTVSLPPSVLNVLKHI
uniref:Uncharacterized protein n=1 Tax=Micrurus spixii TaxID=129469 RepID=A0A2D4LT25_9SAUR